jgi:hypothetical protein
LAVAAKAARSESAGRLTEVEREETSREIARARAREIVPVFPRVVCADNV